MILKSSFSAVGANLESFKYPDQPPQMCGLSPDISCNYILLPEAPSVHDPDTALCVENIQLSFPESLTITFIICMMKCTGRLEDF